MKKKSKINIAETLKEGIDATCAKCGGDAKIYAGGLFCKNCSPPGMEDFVKTFYKTNGGYRRIN